MSNSPHIDQVRQALMDTLNDLRDRNKPMDIDRAKAVAHVASVLVDTAKVENEYLEIVGKDLSKFMEQENTQALEHKGVPTANNPFPSVVTHRLGN